MSVLDIVLLVLLVLSAVFGLIKGFGKSSLKRFGFLAAIAASYFIGIPAARGLMQTGLGNDWLVGLYENTIPQTGIFLENVGNVGSIAQQTMLSDALGELGFPAFFRGFFLSGCCLMDGDVSRALASSFAYYTLIAVLFVLFLIVFNVVLHFLFKLIAEPILGENGKGVVGRLLGMVKRVLQTSLILIVLMMVVVFVDELLLNAGVYGMHDWLFDDLGLGNGGFSLARILYDTAHALLGWISQ